MVSRSASLKAVAAACGLAVCLTASAAASPARAEGLNTLGTVLRGTPSQRPAPLVGRYVTERGPGFVLDRSNTAAPLLKYENSDEIWVLQARPAGRGDMVFVNDAGDVVLRSTRLGGLIMFTEDRPQGMPVALRGDARPIPTDVVMTPQAFVRRLRDAGERISDVAPGFKKITFNSDDSAAPLLAEAAMLTAQAVQNAVKRKKVATVNTLERLVLRDGPAPAVLFDHGVLTVTVTPGLGVAGRPSSERIAKALR